MKFSYRLMYNILKKLYKLILIYREVNISFYDFLCRN